MTGKRGQQQRSRQLSFSFLPYLFALPFFDLFWTPSFPCSGVLGMPSQEGFVWTSGGKVARVGFNAACIHAQCSPLCGIKFVLVLGVGNYPPLSFRFSGSLSLLSFSFFKQRKDRGWPWVTDEHRKVVLEDIYIYSYLYLFGEPYIPSYLSFFRKGTGKGAYM